MMPDRDYSVPELDQNSMAFLFRVAAHSYPDQAAIVSDGERLSFAELSQRTDMLARTLRQRGVGTSSTIAVLALDGLAIIEILIASAKLGARILLLNWRLASKELGYILADARPDIIFASACFQDLAADALPPCPIIAVEADAQNALARSDFTVSDTALPAFSPDAAWLLLYTSGTTGRPKGCQHSQRAYQIHSLAGVVCCGFRQTDRCLLTQPLFHVSGLHTFLAAHISGACAVIPKKGLDAEGLLKLASDEGVTFQPMPILDTIGWARLQRERAYPLAIRQLFSGGGIHDPDKLREMSETFGADILLVYGQTEVGGFATTIRLADQLERPKSCGKPLPHLLTRIVDSSDRDVANGEHGELLIRSPSATIGYLDLPEATREAFADGWLRTGDLCWRDKEGYLYIAGRKKELIKTGAENVYPAEVEIVLNAHPAIEQCCVVGVPDERYGEAVKAFIVLHEGASLTVAEVGSWCRDTIAGYKKPRYVEFVDSIPRDFSGKLQRAVLRRRPVDASQSTRQAVAAL